MRAYVHASSSPGSRAPHLITRPGSQRGASKHGSAKVQATNTHPAAGARAARPPVPSRALRPAKAAGAQGRPRHCCCTRGPALAAAARHAAAPAAAPGRHRLTTTTPTAPAPPQHMQPRQQRPPREPSPHVQPARQLRCPSARCAARPRPPGAHRCQLPRPHVPRGPRSRRRQQSAGAGPQSQARPVPGQQMDIPAACPPAIPAIQGPLLSKAAAGAPNTIASPYLVLFLRQAHGQRPGRGCAALDVASCQPQSGHRPQPEPAKR
jgi:hypothetical protein